MNTLPSAATKTALLLILALAASCAKMGVPPGGPEDKSPPSIVFTSPESDELNVGARERVVLEFSEMMNRPSVESALYLSPEPGNRLRYRWKGRRLTLEFLDSLASNRTHVVSIGTQAKDLKGNTLEKSFTLAFSTGDHIDRGAFAGFAELPEGLRSLSILAYSKANPNPLSDVADYRIQTSSDGAFELNYLAPATYRVFAVADKNLDGKWSPASEIIGTASSDVEVSEGDHPFVTFVPTLQDTTPWKILRAKFLDVRALNLRFNHDATPVVALLDGNEKRLFEHIRPDSSASGSWLMYLGDSLAADSATILATLADTTLLSRIATNHNPDTTRPALLSSLPQNSSRLRDVPTEIIAIFSEPIIFSQQTESLFVSLRKDTSNVQLSAVQSDPASLTITPAVELTTGESYLLEIPAQLLKDYSGNAPNDSVLRINWYSYPKDSLGAVVGEITSDSPAQWIVQLMALDSGEPLESQITESRFEFRDYPAGKARLRIVRDENRNQRFDYGLASPFAFSEPFYWHPETLTVRPRWETESTVIWPN